MSSDKPNGRAIVLHAKDNVATALEPLVEQSAIDVTDSKTIVLQDTIQFGHKFALHFIAKGDPVVKYGVPIGMATSDIQTGEHIHLHNLRSMMHANGHSDQGTAGVNGNEGLQAGGWKNRHT